mmetsp:Transcript_30039/g.55283  ORF Transcript_30039/g.55283 Transcript_30039/m.55283 type:complete len:630 (+) Transcript_30039:118-2007(+)|eukprot:CAMPEP_0196136816 /NCGR_PEP_ID=MMETSP0910-20130528/4996_1 /TAXON_ID=49265 /ORGANISM="Thalassiosira rotula, Strain GSO102" /LENGTH=629 /DNA_ID=CAMNT_0041397161 /DNA_START=96 /DNA_END=1985 /DNA_ORIENTATION=-
MPCPYAAALSDDEDASYHAPANANDTHHFPAEDALSAARLKCPAFANNACPFRETGSDPDSLREVMKTVPPSHFPSSSNALQKMIAMGGKNENNGRIMRRGMGESSDNDGGGGSSSIVVTPFQLAMEHVHQVSSLLDRESSYDRDSFIIRGGCPFKSFHKERPSNANANSSKHLARAMEDFSLSAIMGRMATESFVDFEEEEKDEQSLEESDGNDTTNNKEVGTSTSASDSQSQQDGIANQPQTSQQEGPTSSSLLSQALKTGTAESHTAAENVHFVNNFIQGKIDRDLYAELVAGLYHTYVTLERLLNLHAPHHFPTLHFPEELSRVEALREDMEYWHGSNWEVECRTPSPAVRDYVDRMEEVGRIDPLLLLSHAYTRYLGDLSGGKVLSRIARRALNLGRGYDGLQFYNFERVRSAKLFKDRYRDALDGLVLRSDQVGRLVAEANVAFALNMRVFEELDVRGGVPGARVRNVREALSYYDVEMEEQKKGRSGSARVMGEEEEEAKCPFGYVGTNPHEAMSGGKKIQVMDHESTKSSSHVGAIEKQISLEKEGRCPWPFVFFHDPMTGMKDWQTWFMIGLVGCWLQSCLRIYEHDESILTNETIADGVTVLSGANKYEQLSDLDWFME